jgi:hypothetical protein
VDVAFKLKECFNRSLAIDIVEIRVPEIGERIPGYEKLNRPQIRAAAEADTATLGDPFGVARLKLDAGSSHHKILTVIALDGLADTTADSASAIALGSLTVGLPSPTDCSGMLACALFRWLLVVPPEFHFAINSLTLEFLLQRAQGLVDIVVANKNLHGSPTFGDRDGQRWASLLRSNRQNAKGAIESFDSAALDEPDGSTRF